MIENTSAFINWDADNSYSKINNSDVSTRYRFSATWDVDSNAPYLKVEINNTTSYPIEILGARFFAYDMIGSPYWPNYSVGTSSDAYICRTITQPTFESYFDEGGVYESEADLDKLKNSLFTFIGQSQDKYYDGENIKSMQTIADYNSGKYPGTTVDAYYSSFIGFRRDSTKNSVYSSNSSDYYVIGGGSNSSDQNSRLGRYNALLIPAGSTDYVFIRFPKNYFNRYCIYVPVLYIRNKSRSNPEPTVNPTEFIPHFYWKSGKELNDSNPDLIQTQWFEGVFQLGNESGDKDAEFLNDASTGTLYVKPNQDNASGFGRCTIARLGASNQFDVYAQIQGSAEISGTLKTSDYLNVLGPTIKSNDYDSSLNTMLKTPPTKLTSDYSLPAVNAALTIGNIKNALDVNITYIEEGKYPSSYTSGWTYDSSSLVDLCLIDRRTGKVNMFSDKSSYCSAYKVLIPGNPELSSVYNVQQISSNNDNRVLNYRDRVTPMYDFYHFKQGKTYNYTKGIKITTVLTGIKYKDNCVAAAWSDSSTYTTSVNQIPDTYTFYVKLDSDSGYNAFSSSIAEIRYSDDNITWSDPISAAKVKTTDASVYQISFSPSMYSMKEHSYWKISSAAVLGNLCHIYVYRVGLNYSTNPATRQTVLEQDVTNVEGTSSDQYVNFDANISDGYTALYLSVERKKPSETTWTSIETYGYGYIGTFVHETEQRIRLSLNLNIYDYKVTIYDAYKLMVLDNNAGLLGDAPVIANVGEDGVYYGEPGGTYYIVSPYIDSNSISDSITMNVALKYDVTYTGEYAASYLTTKTTPFKNYVPGTDRFTEEADGYYLYEFGPNKTLEVSFNVYPLTGDASQINYPTSYISTYPYKYVLGNGGTRTDNIFKFCVKQN